MTAGGFGATIGAAGAAALPVAAPVFVVVPAAAPAFGSVFVCAAARLAIVTSEIMVIENLFICVSSLRALY